MRLARPDLDFKLSITRALTDQLDEALRKCEPAPLDDSTIATIEKRSGVYELLLDGALVYVGKASTNLYERLTQHARKLSGRCGVAGADVRFVCLYVDEDLEASAPEKLLIKRHRRADEALWNTNGFGNKDPGRQRDTSAVASNHFDALYPINLDAPVVLTPGTHTAETLLAELKQAALPYLLRYQNPKKDPVASTEFAAASLVVPDAVMMAREALALVVGALPSGWQATALPGYVILYRESPRGYDSATLYWRSTGDGVDEVEGPRRLGPAVEVVDVTSRDDDAEPGPDE